MEQDLRHFNRVNKQQSGDDGLFLLQSAEKHAEINDIRMQLGLKPTLPSDYLAAKESRLDLNSSDSPKDTLEDLYDIPIPKGTAPETEGQIYHSLQLPEIPCRRRAENLELVVPKEDKIIEVKENEPEKLVFSAAPQMHDLMKDVTQFVPLSVKRKK